MAQGVSAVSENVFSEDFSGASVASYAASDLTFLPADKSVRGPVSASCSQVVITLWPSDELNRRQVQSARCRLPGPPAITSEGEPKAAGDRPPPCHSPRS